MKEKEMKFSSKYKLLLAIIFVLGFTIIGVGIGLLVDKLCEVAIVGLGSGIILTVIGLIIIEFEDY